jgi:aldose 1-epimerase
MLILANPEADPGADLGPLGTSSLVVAPEYGAGLTGWMLGRTPMLRRALPQAVAGEPQAMGCFPLLPYGNRLARGCFRWRGTDYRLRPNFGDHPHTIHGLGWQRAWSVDRVDASSVTLTLQHRADASWPFAFDAVVSYALSDQGLTVTIGLTSRHDAPAPAGIGLHPFFPKAHDPALRFDAVRVSQNGADALPRHHADPPVDWCHAAPRNVAESRLDNCFTGWAGTAEILAGPASLLLQASGAFRQLQVFTPSWVNFFCIEPVSHVPDALNRPDLPAEQAMQVLQPDESLSGTVVLCPTGADREMHRPGLLR